MFGIFWEMKKKVEIVGSRTGLKNTMQQQLRVSHVQPNLLAAAQFCQISFSYVDSLCNLSI